MLRRTDLLSILTGVLVFGSVTVVRAQDNPVAANQPEQMKVIVVAPEAKSDSVITVPPATSARFALQSEKRKETAHSDLSTWIAKESALNGLQSTDANPWHLIVTYDQFDEDGDNVHSGTLEEFWAAPTKYKRIYESDNFNQTDYATDHGLFRRGDQRWPTPAELQVRAEVVDPFFEAAGLQGFQTRTVERSFTGHNLECVLVEREPGKLSDPNQYCFEPGGFVLRYTRGDFWYQTVYNRIVSFQGHNIAQDVDVTDGGKPYLKPRVETIESISHVDDADFVPPADAVETGERISGVRPKQLKMSFPEWPPSLRGQHFSVEVEFVIGKDGRVISAHAISGPQEGRKACEDAVRKSLFLPYYVLDRPVEVEAKFECANN